MPYVAFFSLHLGLWHNFKQAQLVIWRIGAQFLWGPLFHFLYPTSRVAEKPKHVFLSWLFTLIRLKLPELADTLTEARRSAIANPASRSSIITAIREILFTFLTLVIFHLVI